MTGRCWPSSTSGSDSRLIAACGPLQSEEDHKTLLRCPQEHGMYSFRLAAFLIVCLTSVASAVDSVEFNRDIRPLLSDHCYACHGPDKIKRRARLRLDIESG